jgi:TnpA family transposase
MSAPHQLTEAQRQRLLTGHYTFSRREMVRHWFLSADDLKRIQQRRREHNRLGYAVQLCLLRYPGWPWRPGEPVPPNLLHYVGQQFGADAAEFAEYAQRDHTRQEHQQRLIQDYRFRTYSAAHVPALRKFLENEALSTDSAFTLVQSALEWLREHRVILPALATVESLVRSVRSQVEREIYGRLFGRLEEGQRAELDKLLELGPSHGSLLGWLRRVPRSCSAAGILDLLQRLHRVRDAGIPSQVTEGIAPNRIAQLAARGARHSVAHFRRFPAEKRCSILAAFLLHVAEELTDRSLDFHRRLIGRLFRDAEKKQWTEFVAQGPGVNEKRHNYARLTFVVTRARKECRPVEDAIAEAFAWETLEQDGQEAARLARPVGTAPFQDFRAQFPQFRQYTPKFLEAFQFEAIPVYQPLLRALDTLREVNRQTRPEIPAHAPRSFVKAKWAPFVFTEKGIDRCYYERCTLSELSWGLKSGDIWVRGSRRYRQFDQYLIQPSVWAQRKKNSWPKPNPRSMVRPTCKDGGNFSISSCRQWRPFCASISSPKHAWRAHAWCYRP